MENLFRNDGVPLEANELIPLIKARKEMAETVAKRFGDASAAWYRGYNDMTDNNWFIGDFGFLLELCGVQDQEIKRLRGECSELKFKLEAAGIENE